MSARPVSRASRTDWPRVTAQRDRDIKVDRGHPEAVPAHIVRGVVIGYPRRVSPTILRARGYRFYFFSREEARPHVHVQHASGEAKFWLEPDVEPAADYGLGGRRVNAARKIIEGHRDEIRAAWERHFGG